MLRGKLNGQLWWTGPLLAWAAYFVCFPVLLAAFPLSTPALSYLIVAGFAWWGGARVGVTQGLLSFVVVTAAYYFANDRFLNVNRVLSDGTFYTVVALTLGALVGHLRDVRDELARQARIDALTGLLNRRAFLHELERAVKRSRNAASRVTIVFLDLDRFKPINDRYGHAVGDEVLIALASRMQRDLAHLGRWCRLGGDEFIVMLVGEADPQAVRRDIERIIRLPLTVGDLELCVGASVGVSVNDEGQDATALMRAADEAMYAMKRGGRALGAFAS